MLVHMTTPEFFLPDAPRWLVEEARTTPEVTYEALAGLAGCSPLPLGERIYSITWHHDGEECTAKVGRGIETHRPESARRKSSSRTYRSTVLAIYRQGGECVIVTDRDPRMMWHDDWDNPLRYLNPVDVTLFAAPEGAPGKP